MSEWEDLAPADRVAEGLWHTAKGVDGEGIAAHKAWLAPPETEREHWRMQAIEVILSWKQSNGFA
jgi:hypothetical protein